MISIGFSDVLIVPQLQKENFMIFWYFMGKVKFHQFCRGNKQLCTDFKNKNDNIQLCYINLRKGKLSLSECFFEDNLYVTAEIYSSHVCFPHKDSKSDWFRGKVSIPRFSNIITSPHGPENIYSIIFSQKIKRYLIRYVYTSTTKSDFLCFTSFSLSLLTYQISFISYQTR